MKQGWEIKKLGEVFKLEYGKPLAIEERNENGLYPVYGANGVISNSDKYYYDKPSIIVGRKGTAGALTLSGPKFHPLDVTYYTTFDDNKYLLKYIYYLLLDLNLPSFAKGVKPGINRNDVYCIKAGFPFLDEQERIVGILDSAFVKIEALRANAQQNLQNTKDLFQASLKQELSPKQGWKNKSVKEISKDIFAGGDAPRDNLSEAKTEKYSIPIYANAVKDDGLYGFTDFARVLEPSLTIAARGSGTGYVLERQEAYLPIVRLIVIIPKYEQILLRHLYYSFKGLDITRSGSAIPQLTVPMIKNYTISFPSIVEQQAIVEKLDALSEHCRAMEENYRQTITHCNALKQALLTKAFNGEL